MIPSASLIWRSATVINVYGRTLPTQSPGKVYELQEASGWCRIIHHKLSKLEGMGEPLFLITSLCMFLFLMIGCRRASLTLAVRLKALLVGIKNQIRSHGKGAWERLVAPAAWKTEERRHEITHMKEEMWVDVWFVFFFNDVMGRGIVSISFDSAVFVILFSCFDI